MNRWYGRCFRCSAIAATASIRAAAPTSQRCACPPPDFASQRRPKLFVSASDAGNEVTCAFCPECGCPLFIRVSARPDIVGLRVASLDDPSGVRPDADIFVKSARPWDHRNPDLPKHQTYPPGHAYTPQAVETKP